LFLAAVPVWQLVSRTRPAPGGRHASLAVMIRSPTGSCWQRRQRSWSSFAPP